MVESAPATGHTPPRLLRWLASLKLCVVLLALIVPLIFFGSLAQRHWGIWEVLAWYFKAPVVQVPLAIFHADPAWKQGWWFPWPGGSLLGAALLVNLCAAFLLHFRLTRSPGRLLGGLALAMAGAALVAAGHLWEPLRGLLADSAMAMLVGGLLLYTPVTLGLLLLYGRKAGLALSHLAIVLLIIGQAAATWGSRETQMVIRPGETAVYSEDVRTYELAVTRPKADGTGDRVEVVDQDLLRPGAAIALGESKLKIEVRDWFKNSAAEWVPAAGADPLLTRPPPPGAPFLADKRLQIREATEVTGVGGQMTNVPGAVLSVNGRALALSGHEAGPVAVELEGAGTVRVALRPRRHYKPFGLRLEEFRHDQYAGTGTPLNYSSKVTLLRNDQPPETHVIRMNEPLRFGGETFYQSSFLNDDAGTVLQVVANPGWTIPYIACALGAVGLLLHFTLSLLKFLRRPRPTGAAPQESAAPAAEPSAAQRLGRFVLPLLAAGLLALSPLARWADPKPAATGGFDLATVGRLPVLSGGRIQPLDSVARGALLQISNRSSVKRPDGTDKSRQVKVPPVAWMLDMMWRPEVAREDALVRIDHPDVKALLGLEAKDTRHTVPAVLAKQDELARAAKAADQVRREDRGAYERGLLETWQRLQVIEEVAFTSRMQPFPPPPVAGKDGLEDGPLDGWLPFVRVMARGQAGERERKRWDAAAEAWRSADTAKLGELDLQWQALREAWGAQDAAAFNAAAAKLDAGYRALAPAASAKTTGEARFNRVEPFWMALYGYVLAALALFIAWLLPKDAARLAWRLAMALALGALLVHSGGLLTRMWLSGRPPVTNLYSSALFIGWGLVVFGLACEWLLARFRGERLGLALLAGCIAGVLSLLIAQGLSFEGDTLAPPQAVLDTNFWLATHVVVITLGYSATFLAGLLGLALLIRRPAGADNRLLGQLITGIVCFALLFSFIGTILGGIWADQSWGRFWGWDPKENGAMIIVLWNALILHARLAGWARERGVAALAIGGNIVTAWSWFGVNLMGAGLHSYGFTEGAALALGAFCLSQLLCIGLAWLPDGRGQGA